ncbi:MAG: 3-dehydro-L-gulonate 2-dehydrogenase [Flavisolibacter sp.]|nr:3-dehydro-L-gulonate 2-dehydrogenase [Flavisolibacter sp.]
MQPRKGLNNNEQCSTPFGVGVKTLCLLTTGSTGGYPHSSPSGFYRHHKMNKDQTISVSAAEMRSTFNAILLKLGFTNDKASQCAEILTSNSIDGVYTHGVNRFPVFVQYIKEGLVDKDAEPTLQSAFNGIEQWNGNLGPGVLNAVHATDRAVQLSQQYGIGCVAMANTNHWMRGGYYGWQAARKGVVFIAWTNTIANMPAWGAVDSKLGNNPLVIALPYGDEAIVLDMAMSQSSFGAMELAAAKSKKLKVASGYDKEGNLTDDPSAIIESRRPLPIGYWKGAGLSLLLDILAAILSGGSATHQITAAGKEKGLSQVFICIDIAKLDNHSIIAKTVTGIIEDYHSSVTGKDGSSITFPGERVLQTRKENSANGIPVLRTIWDEIQKLKT